METYWKDRENMEIRKMQGHDTGSCAACGTNSRTAKILELRVGNNITRLCGRCLGSLEYGIREALEHAWRP